MMRQIAAIPESKRYKIDIHKLRQFVKTKKPSTPAVNAKAAASGKKK